MAAFVVVVFALNREAAPFRRLAKRDRLPVRILVSGVGAKAAKPVDIGDAALVISAGFCGALDPNLKVGDVGISFSREAQSSESSAAVATPHAQIQNGPLRFDPAVARGALGSEDCASRLNLITVDHLVATPDDKRQLRSETGADIVDMEAEHIRLQCVSRIIPFLAVKAVSDTADTALSPDLVGLLANGNVSIPRTLLAILRRPTILLEFRRLARDTTIAANRLAERLVEIVRMCAVPA